MLLKHTYRVGFRYHLVGIVSKWKSETDFSLNEILDMLNVVDSKGNPLSDTESSKLKKRLRSCLNELTKSEILTKEEKFLTNGIKYHVWKRKEA